jgi:hypothetical protein
MLEEVEKVRLHRELHLAVGEVREPERPRPALVPPPRSLPAADRALVRRAAVRLVVPWVPADQREAALPVAAHRKAVPAADRRQVVLPAAHWAPAVRREATLPAAARRRAARPRAVPAAVRAVVPPAADHLLAALPAVVRPAADRRVRSQKVIGAVALRLSLVGSSLSERQSALEQQGGPKPLCCGVHQSKH